MGYTTEFEGQFNLNRPLEPTHFQYLKYLNAFAETRRMIRDAAIASVLRDPVRLAAQLPIGIEGAYFVGSTKDHGQNDDESILDANDPPADQPGLWCQWIPTPDARGIHWNGIEKFYCYVEWLEYIIAHFLEPWGYTLNGQVTWIGEASLNKASREEEQDGHDGADDDENDTGIISVKDNVVTAVRT